MRKHLKECGVQSHEPRINFALASACTSSPNLLIFRPESVLDSLEENTQRYISEHVQYDGDTNSVCPSAVYWLHVHWHNSVTAICSTDIDALMLACVDYIAKDSELVPTRLWRTSCAYVANDLGLFAARDSRKVANKTGFRCYEVP